MDAVEGTRGGKALPALMSMPHCFMPALLMDDRVAADVSAAFAMARDRLAGKFGRDAGPAMMAELFFVLVTDNGAEFTLPDEIEKGREGNKVANLSYANPGASYQKPHVERSHEFIRLVLPKGSRCFLPTSFGALAQGDVDLMMPHIDSYVREASGSKTPYGLMTGKFGVEPADLFNIRRIPANDAVLKPSLLGIGRKAGPEMSKAADPKNCTKQSRRHSPHKGRACPPTGRRHEDGCDA